MIRYVDCTDDVRPEQLRGFFEGWPDPPSPETHQRILRASTHVVLAVDEASGDVVGFINAISDDVLAAYIPLLEVRSPYRGRGIGRAIVERMLARLGDLYMVDLVCDDDMRPFYERFGLRALTAMARRNYAAQAGRVP